MPSPGLSLYPVCHRVGTQSLPIETRRKKGREGEKDGKRKEKKDAFITRCFLQHLSIYIFKGSQILTPFLFFWAGGEGTVASSLAGN